MNRRATRPALVLVAVLVTAIGTTTMVAHRSDDLVDTTASAPQLPPPPAGSPHLRPVDGGPDYYTRFSPSLPTGPDYFPLGVWFESVRSPDDLARDALAGLNLYVQVTADSDLGLIRDAGASAIHERTADAGDETAGWLLSDEADMWAGPGDGAWTGAAPGTGPVCASDTEGCGFTVQQALRNGLPDDQRLRYTNYGKGVAFWETPAEAARFVNDYADVVSVDTYWYTDENICGSSEGATLLHRDSRLPDALCHRAANYGLTVDRVRDLVEPRGSKPVWALVEVGHPFAEDDWPTITAAQVRAAVWSSLIHGARGIVYFNHSFGGPCETDHVLRESCYAATRAAVTRLNEQITRLAPVLNGPTVDGMTTTTGPVDVLTKYADGSVYLLAGSTAARGGRAGFRLACTGDTTVTVLDEGRTIPVQAGVFTDSFSDGEAVHLYRVDGTPSCSLQSETRPAG